MKFRLVVAEISADGRDESSGRSSQFYESAKQDITIHALSGTRTRDPRNRAATDVSLKMHDHRFRPH
jgi:hypothetical protein